MKRLPLLLLLTAGLSVGACKSDNKGATSDAELLKLKKERSDLDGRISKLEAQNKPAGSTTRAATPVTVREIFTSDFTSAVDIQATISGDENILASPQAPGMVTRILVSPGQRVSRGQTLAQLDAAAVDQQIGAQQIQVDLLRTLYQKQQMLWKQNIGTEVQLLTAKANYEASQKQKAGLEAQRNMYRITAPVSGTVDQFDLKVGDIAQPGGGATGAGIRIVNLSQLKVKANLGESYLGKVRIGDPVTIILTELGDSINTRLSYVAQSVDLRSRSFGVEARVGGVSGLRPNMSCRMKIKNYQASNSIVVPVNVVQESSNGTIVYIADGKVAKPQPVKLGRTYNGQVEILEGLKQGDRVVVEGFQELEAGDAISY